jgi:hypothetical protein
MREPCISPKKAILFLLPVAALGLFLGLKIVFPDFYWRIVQEDSSVEDTQVLCYFLAAVGFALSSSMLIKRGASLPAILHGVASIGLFFVAAEEASWGQRALGLMSPGYFSAHNTQQELSVHNLDIIQPHLHSLYILIGAYGAFAWLVTSVLIKKLYHSVRFIIPDWFISTFFLPVLVIYACLDYVFPFCAGALGLHGLRPGIFLIARDQEPAELMLSLGFVLFSLISLARSRQWVARSRGGGEGPAGQA